MILAKRLIMCLLKDKWSSWNLNADVTVTNGIAHYTAYKTNQRDYYDSYADLDLTAAIIRSFADDDMQQWQAVIDACNELTGVTNWTFDTHNSWVLYEVVPINYPYLQRIWIAPAYGSSDPDFALYFDNPEGACRALSEYFALQSPANKYVYRYTGPIIDHGTYSNAECYYGSTIDGGTTSTQMTDSFNPHYDPNYTPTFNSISFEKIAEKIISNTSSSNQAISLLAEAYLENVAKSIFAADESKQFVRMADLIEKFELNKVLRI